jgi:hypothetical protein
MTNQRNVVRAGVAALALIAATGFASAQEQSKQGKEPHPSTQPMKSGAGWSSREGAA